MHFVTRDRIPDFGGRVLPKDAEEHSDLELPQYSCDRERQTNLDSAHLLEIRGQKVFQTDRERLYIREATLY